MTSKKKTRVCTGCGTELPLTVEYFAEKDIGFEYRCRPCLREYNRLAQIRSRAKKKALMK